MIDVLTISSRKSRRINIFIIKSFINKSYLSLKYFIIFLSIFLSKIFEIIKIKKYIKSKILIIYHEYHIQLHLTIICINDWIERERNEKQASYNIHSIHKFIYKSFRNWRNIEFMRSLIIIFVNIMNLSIYIFWEIYYIFQELYQFYDDL